VDPVESLDLEAEGIRTILWATGYLPDHRWIHLPIFDEAGHPKHEGGVTDLPGVAFVGLRYQRWLKSDLFYGVGDDAGHVVERLTATIPA
jgi:putative flavoprotein involved in K+ transport